MNELIFNKKEPKQVNSTITDITNESLKLPEGLFELTPKILGSFMQYASPLSDTPDEFLLMPFLTMAGALIGRKRFIEVGSQKIRPIIWSVLFAGSSTMRKSTSISIAKKPFKVVEASFQKQYKDDLDKWKSEKKAKEQADEEFEIPKPKLKTLFAPDGFSDLTFWECLKDNGSIVSVASEFTGLWTELNKPYANMSELALKLFDGEGGRRVTKTGGDIILKEPMWSIIGAATLENFRNTLTSIQRGSGFLQRIIPVCMENNPKEFKSILENSEEDEDLKSSITEVLLKINLLNTQKVQIENNAREIYDNWSYKMHSEAADLENKVTDIGGYYARLSIYALKFALIFQMLESPESQISTKNMKASIKLCNWIKTHIQYMLDKNYIFDREYADRLKIREIIGKQPEKSISRTKLLNNSHFTAHKLNKVIKSELAAGMIGGKRIDTEGKTKTEYFLK